MVCTYVSATVSVGQFVNNQSDRRGGKDVQIVAHALLIGRMGVSAFGALATA
jgi:hypothetical protein